MIAISSTKVLVYTEATAETLKAKMDEVMTLDVEAAATKLKWKPSRNGGRAIATPSATTSSLAASRKKANKPSSAFDYITEVAVKGEVGREDGEVMRKLMAHVCSSTGLNINETAGEANPKIGEFFHLASRDSAAPPGRMRVMLRNEDEVRKLYAALHGQTVQVGHDLVAIEVSNDLINIKELKGNLLRRGI